MKVRIEFEEGDEVTEQGLRFFAGKYGDTLEEYALDGLLFRARFDEEQGDHEGHFAQLDDELQRMRKQATEPESEATEAAPLAELPPLFAIPQEYRDALPANVQKWLDSVESRIDGLHLEDIEEEAAEVNRGDSQRLFRIARRLFFRRVEQIMKTTDFDLEIGIDVPLQDNYGGNPGCEADRLMGEFQEQERMEQIGKEQREQQSRLSIQKLVRHKVPSFKLPEDFQIPKSMTYPDIADDILAELAATKAAAA